ncbi:hypothetical protein Rt10032_c01g0175 [Rhodotorula toruloides]|uniref:Uncharacterized protein n=1 Tax=Rhodotorula toruloides TaxID=5286 RepID=A0A511K741_RHOTO|nr:hypothetical protein Rt10032_c01g0175 [Rhodotorula toruloides]
MKFSLASLATFLATSSLVAGSPLARRDSSSTPRFTGKLVEPSPTGTTVGLSESFSFALDGSPPWGPPHFEVLRSVDIGIFDPRNTFEPEGVIDVESINGGGPGGWFNTTVTLNKYISEPGQYYLIVNEHQLDLYASPGPVYRVQTYNVSLAVTQ